MANCERLLRLMQREGQRPVRLALDGRCAAGKTTLAAEIQAAMACNVVHMDDFYLPFAQRTEEIMARPGGNMDFGRLCREVLDPLANGKDAVYRPYDCHADRLLPEQRLNAALPTIVEGSYSCHPIVRPYYDLCVFLDVSPECQNLRLLGRDPAAVEMFQRVWIPREEAYFTAYQVRSCCDLCISGEAL